MAGWLGMCGANGLMWGGGALGREGEEAVLRHRGGVWPIWRNVFQTIG